MRFYTGQHTYYCGIDLHTRMMYICILDARGDVVLQRNTVAKPKSFLTAIEPFKDELSSLRNACSRGTGSRCS